MRPSCISLVSLFRVRPPPGSLRERWPAIQGKLVKGRPPGYPSTADHADRESDNLEGIYHSIPVSMGYNPVTNIRRGLRCCIGLHPLFTLSCCLCYIHPVSRPFMLVKDTMPAASYTELLITFAP